MDRTKAHFIKRISGCREGIKKLKRRNVKGMSPIKQFLSSGSVMAAKDAFHTGKGVKKEKSKAGCKELLITSSYDAPEPLSVRGRYSAYEIMAGKDKRRKEIPIKKCN
jgi:hypothetical protein